MAKRRCPKCGRRGFGNYCSGCGTAYLTQATFKERWIEAFGVQALITALVSTMIVMVAPRRMAQEWARGAREFSSPIAVFGSTILVSAVIVQLVIPGYVVWVEELGGNASFSTLAFQWYGTFGPWFEEAYQDSAANTVDHLLRVRQIHNFVVFPYQAVISALCVWWMFNGSKNKRLSKEEAEAAILYPSSAIYLHALIGLTLSWAAGSIALVIFFVIYGIVGTPILVVLAVSRIKRTGIANVWLRCLAAFALTMLLYFPVALVCDLIALHRIAVLDAL